jgi:nucleoside-diphosphate-sugar epimerase
VSDAVGAIIAALDADLPRGAVVNIGSPDTHEVSELLDLISRIVGSEVLVEQLDAHPADPAATIADISQAEELLGWEPKVDLQEGLEEQVTWAKGF